MMPTRKPAAPAAPKPRTKKPAVPAVDHDMVVPAESTGTVTVENKQGKTFTVSVVYYEKYKHNLKLVK